MSDTTQVTFRLQTELLARLQEYSDYLNQLTPGLGASRVDALRILLVRGLEQVEPTYKTTPTKAQKTPKKKEDAR